MENPAEDLNVELLEEVIGGYNGVPYFNEFMFDNIDSFVLLVILFSLLFIGINVVNDLVDTNGNYIMTRTSFRKYLNLNILYHYYLILH